MRKKIIILLIFSVIALLFLISLVSERYSKRKEPRIEVKISKSQAISLAEEAALKAGYKVDKYNFKIYEDAINAGRPCYYLSFEHQRPYLPEAKRFVVWVDKETGQTEVDETLVLHNN